MAGRSPIMRLIDSAVHCSRCGKQGPPGSCDCWEHCSCGWWAMKGEPCRNPNTARCSTKMKYGLRAPRARRAAAARRVPVPE
jgi:hypothetical protein